MTYCEGSGSHVAVSVGQRRQEAGYARPNVATDVHCPVCSRRFPRVRISYTDHGIPLNDGAGLVPRHNKER